MHRDNANHTEDNTPLSEAASHWWVVLNSENASAADRRNFSDWVARSPERIGAFLQTERLMRALKADDVQWPDTPPDVLIREARAAGAQVVSLTHPDFAPRQVSGHKPHRRGAAVRGLSAVGAVAAVIVAVVTGWLFVHGPQHYQTELGEQHSVILDDGSLVTLNTASKIEVDLQEKRRVVRLVQGEALFQVAKDNSRPFEVIAGSTTVRAIGTQFNVDRRAASTTVTVLEGKVAVSSAPASSSENPTTSTLAPSAGTVLTVAQRLIIQDSKPRISERVANLAATIAWTQRRLVFERRPLGEVAEEFNRYNRKRIEIDGPQLRQQEVTGVFQANDPESFVAFLSQISGVTVRKTDDGAHIIAAQAQNTGTR